jgi:hypothetical protein
MGCHFSREEKAGPPFHPTNYYIYVQQRPYLLAIKYTVTHVLPFVNKKSSFWQILKVKLDAFLPLMHSAIVTGRQSSRCSPTSE